jgi:hypothetical protein
MVTVAGHRVIRCIRSLAGYPVFDQILKKAGLPDRISDASLIFILPENLAVRL